MGPVETKWLQSRSRRKALVALAGLVAGAPLVGSRASAQLDPRLLKDHKRLPGLDEMMTAFDFEPVMWGLAAYGADGVRGVIEMLQTELGRYMAMCGRSRVEMLRRDVLRVHAATSPASTASG